MWLETAAAFCVLLCGVQRSKSQSKVDALCNDIVPDGYEIYKAPDEDGNPINVLIGFQVLDIGEVDEEKMDFHLHVFVSSVWNDSRLHLHKYQGRTESEYTIIYEKCRHYIWTPDIFFETAKIVENYERTLPSTLIKVLPDGAIIMSTRYSFKAGCHMNFEDYPFDSQECVFFVSLMSSSDSVAVLKWVGESQYEGRMSSIKLMRKSEPLQFFLRQPTAHSITEVFAEGNYTSLLASFRMVRRLTGSIMNTYAPSIMIVTMSWVSFWLKVDAVPARVALSVTSLLTLCTQVDQYKSQLPPVNYIKAMDIWLFVCILMVFSSLVMFAISYNIHTRICKECIEEKQNEEKSQLLFTKRRKIKMYSLGTDEDRQIKFIQSAKNTVRGLDGKDCPKCEKKQYLGTRVDIICRTVFPGSFLIFAIIYWVYYLKIYHGHIT
ncbi:glycine receptor subunit alpha-2 [Nephila pilipes]|uniref:Glycine receptor subunit alpha-2 n=1 Tax=Nephila pilipes TaxID=299642 RepID=A0A8X6TVB0_NEPPI|nr:glycine receptor subunit alpha-2 [Nephila pilipes]